MPWKTNVTVAAVVERDHHFLLVEETTPEGIRFNQPAGHLEAGECILDAVIRETREETGRNFAPKSLTEISLWQHNPDQSYLRICFTGEVSEVATDAVIDQEIIAEHWLTLEQIEALEGQLRSPLVLQCIKNYLTGNRYPLDLLTTVDFSEKS